MGHYYQNLDRVGGFEYELHQIPGLGAQYYRGPALDTARPYLAFVGAAQTFGRFASEPFPTLLGRRLNLPVLNLGIGGASPRHFNTRKYLSLLNGAEMVVIQALSGRNALKSRLDNSTWGRLRGLTSLSKEPTGTEQEFFTRAQTLEDLVAEARRDYTDQFVDFLEKISAPKILFWLSTRTPAYQDDYESPRGILGPFPHLVNSRMVAEIAAFCDDYVESISKAGLPQTLWPGSLSIDGAVSKNGVLENHYYPSPGMHIAAADALEGVCRKFLGVPERNASSEPTRFVIVATERTGTNLLISLLNQYEQCFCGNELFNPHNIADDVIPWRDIPEVELPRLLAFRREDPIAFWNELCATSQSHGHRVVGFKLMYAHGLAQKPLLDRLSEDRTVRIIHLTRRNLLRRLVSENQARATNQWAVARGAKLEPRPSVAITMDDIVKSIQNVKANQATFNALFSEHQVLRIVYEDLAERPERVAARAADFLGLPPLREKATIKYQKTGTKNLSEALIGMDDLRARMRRWISFFDR